MANYWAYDPLGAYLLCRHICDICTLTVSFLTQLDEVGFHIRLSFSAVCCGSCRAIWLVRILKETRDETDFLRDLESLVKMIRVEKIKDRGTGYPVEERFQENDVVVSASVKSPRHSVPEMSG